MSTAALTTRLTIVGAWAALLVGVAALWALGMFDGLWRPGALEEVEVGLSDRPWVFALVFAATVAGMQIAIPQGLLVAGGVLLLGFWFGLAATLAGTIAAASVTYYLGRWLARRPLRRHAGARFKRVSRMLARRGILHMTLLNLLPIGPLSLVNLAAGASHLRFREFFIGTTIGITPPTVAIAAVTEVVIEFTRTPSPVETAIGIAIAVVTITAVALLSRWSWGWLSRQTL